MLSPSRVGATPWLLDELLTCVLSGAVGAFSSATITDAYLQIPDGGPDTD